MSTVSPLQPSISRSKRKPRVRHLFLSRRIGPRCSELQLSSSSDASGVTETQHRLVLLLSRERTQRRTSTMNRRTRSTLTRLTAGLTHSQPKEI